MTDIFLTINFVTNILMILIGLYLIFFKDYFSQKGKNLATIEDISSITSKVEDVKALYVEKFRELDHKYNLLLENQKSKTQLSLAAIDKRLEVHQEAFILWRKLFKVVHNVEKMHQIALECMDFWEKNCLYLSEEASNAFVHAVMAAQDHEMYKETRINEDITNNWKVISSAGLIITNSVALPSIAELSIKYDQHTLKKN